MEAIIVIFVLNTFRLFMIAGNFISYKGSVNNSMLLGHSFRNSILKLRWNY